MNKVIQFLLLEEEEEGEEMLMLLSSLRQPTNNLFQTRRVEGYFKLLINGHFKDSDEKFRQFLRLNPEQFNFILSLVAVDLKKKSSNAIKYPISPAEKLALTLRFLASGESYRSLAFGFRISHSYISIIIRDTLGILKTKLLPLFLPEPTTENLKERADEFWKRCDFPNCVGAVDGKHIRIFCPNESGPLFFNYKDYFSIVLLALVDANCKFLIINVGSYGKEGDSGIFAKSSMGQSIFSGALFPKDSNLPSSNKVLPYVIIGDEAFRLHRHIMKPYTKPSANSDREKAVFNYRLSRARRVSENAFGLLCQVFRIFYTPIAVKPETCDDIVIVACCLHNLLRDAYLEKNGQPYYEHDPKLKLSTNISPLKKSGGYSDAGGFIIREEFTEYLNREGAVKWQEEFISRLSS